MTQIEPKEEQAVPSLKKLPQWFRQKIPNKETIKNMKDLMRDSDLHTVCEEAHCPNMGECFKEGTATFMILGDVCTRRCGFCAVESGEPRRINEQEPAEVAKAVKALNLKYVVITSVTRDDLEDGGAGHFARTIGEIRKSMPEVKVEVLIPDLENNISSIETVVHSKPFVVGHNIETVRRLFDKVRPQADYERSLAVLKNIKVIDDSILTKSGFMVGLGESKDDIIVLMNDLKDARCDILTIGQYLAPSKDNRHFKVERFVDPIEFKEYEDLSRVIGFKHVMSGPLVRSSYRAEIVIQR
ncbi:MAG: lipoyl synthase [Candidatus Omnitrophica bacterium]|nr:lipoyl synthase [Candidatus Omnitrophota bacterium]MBU1997556.1 lipoyl synthase [Candidatus Omnitrophota bacterium]MBU4333724.1 lipoyl synthase [Candidatus Omnitrophota bacterium]